MDIAQKKNSPEEKTREKLNEAVKKYRKQLDDVKDDKKRKELKKDLKNRVDDAVKILLAIHEKHNPTVHISDGTITASCFDGLVNYNITLLKIKYDSESWPDDEPEKELKPYVLVSCKALGRGYITYKYKKETRYKEENGINPKAFADLFDWVIESVSNPREDDKTQGDSSLSYDDIEVISHDLSWSDRLPDNPDSKFIKLIANCFPDISEADKEKYYRANKKGKIEKVDPLKILQDSGEADYSFERKLRKLIISLAAGKSDDELKKFFMSGDETGGSEDDADERLKCDEIASMENTSEDFEDQAEDIPVSYEALDYGRDYNNLLMNECICFGDAKPETKLCDDEKKILGYVKNVLIYIGKKNAEVSIDDKGVIFYTFKENKRDIFGYIGQVFLSETKLIKTRFLVNNYWFVPEYRAYMKKISAKDNGSLEERTILSGYMQQLRKLLYLRITADTVKIDKETVEVGTPTSLNGIYRKLFEARFDYDFLAEKTENIEIHNKLDLGMRQKIIQTLSRKVRYPDYFSEGSMSINALVKDEESGKENEYYVGDENIYLIDGTKGYFDPEATSSGKTQGSARYLVESASVNQDGTIKPGKAGDRTPIFNDSFLSNYSKYNPFDRNQMVFSNLMRAYNITEPEGTALMTCGGWNMEDAFVISKEFAEKYQVPNNHPDEKHTGPFRPLMVGDKMLDRGGNKGVISAIIDRDGNNESLSELTKLFKDNPDLHVIASPYSGLSRFNGATARELMENTSDLTYNGKTYEKCMGKAQYIITRQFADVKTKIYDEEKYRKGESRQASAQLSWALCSKDAREMMRCLYKVGDRAEKDLKDVVSLVSVVCSKNNVRSNETFYAIREGQKNSDESNRKKDEEIDEILNRKDECRLWIDYGVESGLYVRILPQSCRPGYTDNAGRHIESDITKQYRELLLSNTRAEAEKIYLSIRSLLSHEFHGKNNIFKTRLMTRSVKYSATAIWTPDPRLPIESIAISRIIADGLKVKEGNYLLIWRDPVLRDSNVRYMKVERIDDELTGIAINPVMAKSFDGDFDGDTVAVVKISYDTKAHEEAIRKFSVENNLFDEGRTNRPLSINTKLDLISTGKAEELEAARKAYFEGGKSAEETLDRINEILQEAFEEDYCLKNAMIKLSDEKSIIDSLSKIADDGAKKGNITDYETYFNNKSTNKDRTEVQKATVIKAAVGIAGRYSQQLMRAFREICPKAVLELTYPNTQALLQIKHDPKKAVEVYKMLKNELMDAWEMKDGDQTIDSSERIRKIKELYNKDNLNQPIGDDGIDEKYLIELEAAMGNKPLSECHGTYLDEQAYPTDKYSWGEIEGEYSGLSDKYNQLFEYFVENCSTDKLACNKDFLVEAVAENSEVIRCIPKESKLIFDKDIVLAAVKKNGMALRHIADAIKQYQIRRDDETIYEIVKEAVSNCGYSIKYAPNDLKNNEEIKRAVNENQEVRTEGYEGLNYDRDIVEAAVTQNGMALKYAPGFQNDPEIVSKAVSQNGRALEYAPELQNDRGIVKKAVSQDGGALDFARDFKDDRGIVETAVSNNGAALHWASDELKKDYRIVKIAVSNHYEAIEYADEEFQNDPGIADAALSNDARDLEYFPDYQKDHDKVLEIVKQNGLALRYAVSTLKDDPNIVNAAVSNNGMALRWASDELKRELDIVETAVSNAGDALEYAIKYQKDFDIVKTAVSNSGKALEWASADLKQNRDIVLASVEQFGQALQWAYAFRDNPEIVHAAVSQDGLALRFAPDLQNDEKIVRTAVSQNGLALAYASEYWKHDQTIVLTAVSQNGLALEYVPDDLKTDEITEIAVSQNGLALKYVPDDMKTVEIVEIAVSQNGLALEYAPEYQFNRNIALIAVKQNGEALQYLTDKVKNDKGEMISENTNSCLELAEKEKNDRDSVLKAVEKDGIALKYASDNLKNDRYVVLAALSNDYRALQYACSKRYSDYFFCNAEIIREYL